MQRYWLSAALLALFAVGCHRAEEEQTPPPSYSTFWVERQAWSISSIPVDDWTDHRRGRMRWHNPNTRNAVPVQDVHPERELNAQVPNVLPSLRLDFEPDSSSGQPPHTWGGVMRYLGEEYANQSHTQFLEFWLQLPTQPEGRLVVDLGAISEDALPNDTLDLEDLPPYDGMLDNDEDVGLDGHAGVDPTDSARWNGLDQPLVPSWDDWEHVSNSDDFSQANGTEHSRNDEYGTSPDTEDLNGNDVLDLANDYYSYNIELTDESPYIVGGLDNVHRWRQFRIPLHNINPDLRRAVGAPDFAAMRWMRIYITGLSQPTHFEIVEMSLILEQE